MNRFTTYEKFFSPEQAEQTLPDGQKVYVYDTATRNKGKTIMFLSLIIFAVALTYKLANAYVHS